ncbi:MAG: riboflavin synthase [Oculatellaceae cyanobacterium Prado106]|jgi:riboflavin synthase|nr:riboflavin synthase [Oculatellaceae cyanobacterium Prado106]
MFTGLIQTIGKLRPLGSGLVQVDCGTTAPHTILKDLEIGDSVAVDGICLTVTRMTHNGFVAAVSPETLSRTTLMSLNDGSGEIQVNLESSLRVGSKLGGHFVTGHIDGTGYLESSVQTEIAWEMSFQVPDGRIARYIVPKGSISINGVSLTVASCNSSGSWFKVAVIPLTYSETNLQHLQPGSPVNLEGDVLGKYVEKFLRLGNDQHQSVVSKLEITLRSPDLDAITPSFLADHGYL